MEKKDNWFVNYHEIPQLKIKGTRNLSPRLSFFDPKDFKNSSVLDLGCNTGQMSYQAEEWGASNIIAVDYDKEAIKKAKEISKKINSNVMFVVDDLENNFFWLTVEPHDVVLFLAIIGNIESEKRYSVLSKACLKTKNVLYFEGHAKKSIDGYIKNIMDNTDFTNIMYLGQSPHERPFFRCSRDVLSSEEAVDKILNCMNKYKKIAVIGKGRAGKSIIRKKLVEKHNTDFTIMDDLRICKKGENEKNNQVNPENVKKFKKLVVFDYSALSRYSVNDFEAVFFVTPKQNFIWQNRKESKPFHCPSIGNNNQIKEFYTVKSY